uniref:O-phosphoseryl-tRNA(Sec) selenium transferase n=1 Tax=Echinococcus granulosus TaxID=6210 RepID=A0A068WYS4_ECHGR|nr:o phosphoseryl tRNASec selenium [Echinococcus granulosus]
MLSGDPQEDLCESISRYIGVNAARRAVQRLCGVEARFNNVIRTVSFHFLLSHVLAHGIGRSGDITAIQPKASGSSLINRLSNALLLDWLRRSGNTMAHFVYRFLESVLFILLYVNVVGAAIMMAHAQMWFHSHLIRNCGSAPSTEACLLVPMATGMTLTLCLLTLKRRRGPQAKYVIWPRIDQKSCLKCITAAGLIPVPIEPIQTMGRQKRVKKNGNVALPKKAEEDGHSAHADQLSSDLDAIRAAMLDPEEALRRREGVSTSPSQDQTSNLGPKSIVCVLSTTSCFAPRVPDRLPAITRLCKVWGVPHLVNNAYGVQSKRCMRLIESAWAEARQPAVCKQTEGEERDVGGGGNVDDLTPLDLIYVQSTDKNLMVPVGGAVIAGFSKSLLQEIAESYPGRASGSPSLDVFATLLHLGRSGWEDLLAQREACYLQLSEGLRALAAKHGLRLMDTPENPISLALSLHALCSGCNDDGDAVDGEVDADATGLDPDILTQLGANLFTQGCSGVRVVVSAAMERRSGLPAKVVAGVRLEGFNSHSAASSEAYMNAAAALGQTPTEVDVFLSRLDKALSSFQRRQRQQQQRRSQDQDPTEWLNGSL